MKTSVAKIIAMVLSLVFIFSLIGCDEYSDYTTVTNVIDNYEDVDILDIFLEKGESYEVDFKEQFKDSGMDIKKIVSSSSDNNVFTVKNNKITATGAGKARLWVEIYNEIGKQRHFATAAYVYVFDVDNMIEVKTVQDLANMNLNKTGNYILKSDIDLAEWGDWEPIGNNPYGNEFKGMFVNPDSYIIKNLTISSATNIFHTPSGFCNGGLFGSINNAYIDGIILENVFINVTDFDGEFFSRAGGIAAYGISSVIRNCKVNGIINSQIETGGIIGSDSWGRIISSSFKGTVKSEDEHVTVNRGSGGIAGHGYIVKDCHAEGTVDAFLIAGGIMGWATYEYYIFNSSFTGELLNAQYKGEIIGYWDYT